MSDAFRRLSEPSCSPPSSSSNCSWWPSARPDCWPCEKWERAGDLASLQHKIEAYRQMQHDTLRQLYSVSSALAAPDNATLPSALRQINQFGYDLDRVSFVAKDEVALLGRLREEYSRFIAIATRVLELTRDGRTSEAKQVQTTELAPLADRLERLTNQLVNRAEVDMVNGVDASRATYETSQVYVVAFALAGFVLTLALGYAISWSIVGPVQEIDERLNRIAAGDFSQRVAGRIATSSARSPSTSTRRASASRSFTRASKTPAGTSRSSWRT